MAADTDIEPCRGCGGPHPFDTQVPSPSWKRVIRDAGIPDFLCATCIVAAFTRAGEGFTAELRGQGFDGVAVEFRVGGKVATDALELFEANRELTHRLRDTRAALRTCVGALDSSDRRQVSSALTQSRECLEQKMP